MIAAAAALASTVFLGGCGLAGGSDDVTLELVAADYGDTEASSTEPYWKDLARAYEDEHPGVRVNVTVLSWNDVDREVREMVEAGRAPDMAQIGAYADYADEGLLYRADDLLSIPVQANFVSQLASAGQVDGVQYGLPFAGSTRVLFYNRTLFEEAGLTPPKSWDDLAETAGKLKERGVKYPYALPLGPEEAQAETMQWMLSGGSGYTDGLGVYTIDSPSNVSTFTWLRDELVGKGLTGPVAPGEMNRAAAFTAFANGQVGMLNGHPSLMKIASKKGVKYGMVPTPGIEGENRNTLGVTDWMTAFKQNGHADQVGDFLDFVYSDENVLAFSRKYDLLPVTATASQTMAAAAQDKDLRPFLDELQLSELYPAGKTSWASVSADVKKLIGRAVVDGGDPAQVLGDLQRTATRAGRAD
ncbi:ABC transporter substrate-binding protein [Streptomyces sp. SHP 1-2]|uniref:ABC transporter substrate-binding protein n=1 Tax=Streptomyces sp. SHP 1-2 TaxID=2769489 RepID=UPI002238F0BD|nr:extracellular solute-binding protein [Streptomyces sp. SHP 1-2]MCW5250789.1 extracellular solute-binding protein [Streptomyces sp. SHP 1-2]